MTTWLDHVTIAEFSENLPRPRSAEAEPGRCGALPAQAFRYRYRAGCLREADHGGSHAPEPRNADRLEAAARRRSHCE